MNFILETYIKDITICDKLIHFFDESRFSKLRKGPGVTYRSFDKKSTDLTIHPGERHLAPIVGEYIGQLYNCGQEYIEKYPWCNKYAPWGLTEGVNIQHYKPNEGFLHYHAERTNDEVPYSTRHLVWMTYLNDVEDGGGTEFYHQNLIVKPRKGKTLIWPADWTHTHRGITSPTQEKYVITGWFNYQTEVEFGGNKNANH